MGIEQTIGILSNIPEALLSVIGLFVLYFLIIFIYTVFLIIVINIVFNKKFMLSFFNRGSGRTIFVILIVMSLGLYNIANISGFISSSLSFAEIMVFYLYLSLLFIIIIGETKILVPEASETLYKSSMSFILIFTLLTPTRLLANISNSNVLILALCLFFVIILIKYLIKKVKIISDLIIFKLILSDIHPMNVKQQKRHKGVINLGTILLIIIILFILYYLISQGIIRI